VSAGAEGSTRVDHHGQRVLGRRLPRRPNPEKPDLHRVVELAPALFPAALDLDGLGVRERGEDALGGLAVGCELDQAGRFGFLEALRRQLDEAGAELLGLVCLDGDGRADQWNALFSFSKKPGSCR
jgi:hypothetical protein